MHITINFGEQFFYSKNLHIFGFGWFVGTAKPFLSEHFVITKKSNTLKQPVKTVKTYLLRTVW